MQKTIVTFTVLLQLAFSQEYYHKNNSKVYLDYMHTETNENTTNVSYYQTENGIVLGITDQLIVKTEALHLLETYVQELNASIEKELAKDLYLVKVADSNKTLDIANTLHEKESIIYAHPDFIKKRMLR